MSFKKTVTFTANVSDYTDGTVSARVQAENKILGDLVTFILSHNLGISIQEKCEIGSSKWAGDPLWCSSSGAAGEVYNDKKCTDVYFLGRGINKKCLGLSVDRNEMYIGLTDTPTRDLEFPKSSDTYGRLPCGQMRYEKNEASRDYKLAYCGVIRPIIFSASSNVLSLNVKYWKKSDTLVISIGTCRLVITKEPYTIFYTDDDLRKYSGMHYSLDDDHLISDATYSFNADNLSSSSNYDLGYAMSYSPYFLRTINYSVWESSQDINNISTCISCHLIGVSNAIKDTTIPPSDTNGLKVSPNIPTVTAFMFPRIANNELYIKKFYVPMTYPAVASPIKIGYTPGKLNAENVYSLNGKNYVCLNNGVIGLFVEVENQGD